MRKYVEVTRQSVHVRVSIKSLMCLFCPCVCIFFLYNLYAIALCAKPVCHEPAVNLIFFLMSRVLLINYYKEILVKIGSARWMKQAVRNFTRAVKGGGWGGGATNEHTKIPIKTTSTDPPRLHLCIHLIHFLCFFLLLSRVSSGGEKHSILSPPFIQFRHECHRLRLIIWIVVSYCWSQLPTQFTVSVTTTRARRNLNYDRAMLIPSRESG